MTTKSFRYAHVDRSSTPKTTYGSPHLLLFINDKIFNLNQLTTQINNQYLKNQEDLKIMSLVKNNDI